MPFIDDITCTIYDMSSTVYDITFIICVTSHNACISDITHCMFMTYPLYMASHSVMTTPPLCNFTANMSDITPTVSVSSPPLDQFYQPQYMYAITATMCMTSYALQVTSHPQFRTSHHFMMSGPLYLTSLPLYLCHHTHPVDDITATIWMNSHSVYLWHHIHYIYYRVSNKYDITTLCVHDATLSICMTNFALQSTMPPLYQTKPQYLWCHIHFRHYKTAPVSDIAPTVSISSHSLHWHVSHFCITLHPSSVLHHMNYI